MPLTFKSRKLKTFGKSTQNSTTLVKYFDLMTVQCVKSFNYMGNKASAQGIKPPLENTHSCGINRCGRHPVT